MREFPPALYDSWQFEFDHSAKTCEAWKDFFTRKIPLNERIAEFCRALIYFAASDLAYIDHNILPRPLQAIFRSLEYIADRLESDGDLLAALWFQRRRFDGTRECRWWIQHRTREEQTSGQR